MYSLEEFFHRDPALERFLNMWNLSFEDHQIFEASSLIMEIKKNISY